MLPALGLLVPLRLLSPASTGRTVGISLLRPYTAVTLQLKLASVFRQELDRSLQGSPQRPSRCRILGSIFG